MFPTNITNHIKLINHVGVAEFSKTYEDTLTEDSYTPDLILKIGPEKKAFCCHRLMLVAASDFLRSIIATVLPGTVPVVLLPDLDYNIMEYVLMFIYFGEVQVPTDKYPEFIEASKLLMLKGFGDEIYQITTEDNGTEMQIKDEQNDLEEFNFGNMVQIDMGYLENVACPLMVNEWVDETEMQIEGGQHNLKDDEIDNAQQIEISDPKPSENVKEDVTDKDQKRPSLNRNKPRKRVAAIKIDITPQKEQQAQERLIQSVQNAYDTLGVPFTPKLRSKIRSSKLIVEDNKLIRGSHDCGFCGNSYSITYKANPSTGTIAFSNKNFKMHLKLKHKDHIKSQNLK